MTALPPPQDLNLPGYRLHTLKGELKGFWSVTVRANWRIIFRFQGVDHAGESGKRLPGVAIGTYAAVLFVLGMIDRLRELAVARSDELGLALEEERLPRRIEIRPRRIGAAPMLIRPVRRE